MTSAAENYMPSEKQCLEYCPGKDRTLNYKAQSDHATKTVHFEFCWACQIMKSGRLINSPLEDGSGTFRSKPEQDSGH